MLRVGLIGCGGIGAVHARCWMSMGDRVTLSAIADFNRKNANEISAQCGAVVYGDAIEMMKKEKPDIIDICLPTFLHARYVEEALRYSKKIIVEKPICLNEQEAAGLIDITKNSEACVLVGHVLRYFDSYRYLRDITHKQTYGKLIEADFYRLSGKPIWVKDYDNVDRTGGMPLDLHIHDADFIRYIMRTEPSDVYSAVIKGAHGEVSHIRSTYIYDDAVINAEAAWNYPTSMKLRSGFRALFENAAIVENDGTITVYPEGMEEFVPEFNEKMIVDSGINLSDISGFVRELNSFVDYFEGKEDAEAVTLEDAIGSFRLVQKELQTATVLGGKK